MKTTTLQVPLPATITTCVDGLTGIDSYDIPAEFRITIDCTECTVNLSVQRLATMPLTKGSLNSGANLYRFCDG